MADARRVRERARTGGADSADEREAGLMFLKGKDNLVTAPGAHEQLSVTKQTSICQLAGHRIIGYIRSPLVQCGFLRLELV